MESKFLNQPPINNRVYLNSLKKSFRNPLPGFFFKQFGKVLSIKKVKFIYVIVCLILSGNYGIGFSQNGHIAGYVRDAETEEPLADVNITLKGTPLGAATSSKGTFLLTRVPAGTYTIVVSRIGYKTIERKITLGENDTLQISFALAVEPLSLPEIVVNREMLIGNPDRIYGIPGSAHYIDLKELEKHNYNDIHRALQKIPGINLQEEDGYGLRPNIGLRGTGSERSQKISLMEDGILIAPAPYSAPAAYYFPTIGRMQGIEIRKGSSQIKYGPFTTGGALNLISTKIPSNFEGHIKLLAGKDNARTIYVSVGDAAKNLGFLAETYQSKVDGFKRLDGGGDTGFDKKDYLVKLRVSTNPQAKIYQELLLKIGQTDEVSNETYLGLTDADFKENPFRRYAASQKDLMKSEHQQFQIRYFIRPLPGLDLTTTVYRNNFQRNWYKLDRVRATADGTSISIADILGDPIHFSEEYQIITGHTGTLSHALEVKANNRKYYSQGIQLITGMEYEVFDVLHEVEFGLRYHEDAMDRFQWIDIYKMDNGIMKLVDSGLPGTESNRIESAKVWASFLQYRISLGKFTAVPGIRYENIYQHRKDYGKADPERSGKNLKTRNNRVSVWIPGIGLDYQFTPLLSTFAGIHKGFAPPGSRPGTKPEESINYEIGLRYYNNSMDIQSVFFLNDYQNLLGPDLAAIGGEGSGNLFNGGKVEVSGLEFSFNYDLGKMLKLTHFAIPGRLAYTYTNARFKSNFQSEFKPWGKVETGFELPYVPRYQIYLGLGLERGKWNIDVNGKYISQMRTIAGRGNFIPSQSTDAHTIIDASLEYQLNNRDRLFINIRNLSNAVYVAARRPAGVRPGLPRTVMVGIKTAF